MRKLIVISVFGFAAAACADSLDLTTPTGQELLWITEGGNQVDTVYVGAGANIQLSAQDHLGASPFVQWRTLDVAIATVSAGGVLSGVSMGTTEVYATATAFVSASATVIVN